MSFSRRFPVSWKVVGNVPLLLVQTLLGHEKLNTTMAYAYAYDKTVVADYFAAINRIE